MVSALKQIKVNAPMGKGKDTGIRFVLLYLNRQSLYKRYRFSESTTKMKSKVQLTYIVVTAIFMTLLNPTGFGRDNFKLQINPRHEDALSGSVFAEAIKSMALAQREQAIWDEIQQGNLPAFLRDLVAVETSLPLADTSYSLIFFVGPDYLSIGSDTDHFLMPMTPILAQKVTDQLGAVLPTRKMVDLIWAASEVKLAPEPIPPSAAMVTVGVFRDHDSIVERSRVALITDHPLGSLVSGHKKDVILSNSIASKPDKVIIYGWHYSNGDPIQPLYSGHANWYADYSHGIRLILNRCLLNNSVTDLTKILRDPNLYRLISDESGAMETTRYDTSQSNYP